MKTVLRYPGGKSRAVKHLLEHIPVQASGQQVTVLSPFFGGGALELALLDRGYHIIANDKFEPLYNFWVALKNEKDRLVEEVKKLHPITKELFFECRKRVIDMSIPNVERAACYFALNRSSFSGCTLSGGFSAESGRARFNEASIARLNQVDLRNIEFYNMDFVPFLEQFGSSRNTFIYLDPPYLLEGTGNKLYGNQGDMHESFDHDGLQKVLSRIDVATKWIMSYNDCKEVRTLYDNKDIVPMNWAYGMNKSKKSSELLLKHV